MEAKRMTGVARQLVLHRVLGFAGVLDSATNSARVGVNTDLAYRRDRSLRPELAVDNTVGLLDLGLGGSLALPELPLTNVAVLSDGSNPDRLVTQSGYAFLPRTPESFLYDADGNLLRDGRWIYTWDAENRLVRVQSRSDTPPASWRRVEWQYDALGRRIRQTTSVWTNGTWQVTEDLKLISDPVLFGRHIAELNATNNLLVRSYVWGLDLSGTLDGAGGVGGLLWITVHSGQASAAHFCVYDGNGNVVGLVNASTGTETARYEYGPFAEPIRVSGPAARPNPFRFSTKRTDDTIDLVLYEYRVYSPTLAWWPNRDPIGERGFELVANRPKSGAEQAADRLRSILSGLQARDFRLAARLRADFRQRGFDLDNVSNAGNLYGFVENDAINHIDPLGLITQEELEELKKEIELIQKMRDLANEMIKNFKNCKPQCLGVSSVVAHYCNCYRDFGKNCDDFAECLCVQLPDDRACKARARKACNIVKQVLDAYEKSKGDGGDDD